MNKNILVYLFSIISVMSCSKKDNTKIPEVTKCPDGYSGGNCSIASSDKLVGSYKCTLVGTLTMTFSTNYSCRTGTRNLNYSFNCNLKSTGPNMMEADSIIGTKINLTVTSPTSFSVGYFFYDPTNCNVPFLVENEAYLDKDTITLTNTGYWSEEGSSIRNQFVLKMIKQ